MSSRVSRDMWNTYRAMSEVVGGKNKIFRDTACMSLTERKMVGICEGFIKMFKGSESPEVKRFIEFLNKQGIPFIQTYGRAKWGRDIVTDLGFAKSIHDQAKTSSAKKALEFEPK